MLTPAYFNDAHDFYGQPASDEHRRRNFDLCRAVNLTSLGVVLADMVDAGMPPQQQACFYAAADALLQLMRTENNRLKAAALSTSTKESSDE
jgi:hypothetical protein